MPYTVTDLQACAMEQLTRDDDVTVEVVEERDSMGWPRVSVTADSRERLLAYVRENWGDDETTGGWYSEFVLPQVDTLCNDDEQIDAVDTAWYEITKGELMIGPSAADDRDGDLERLILHLWAASADHLRTVDDTQIACRTGEEIVGAVDEADEIPARVARALSMLWYGV